MGSHSCRRAFSSLFVIILLYTGRMSIETETESAVNSRLVVIIGAGPAGCFAAINAARHGAQVTVLEKMPKPGRKLLATGGGRCNVTNTLSIKDFIARFGPAGRFMNHALQEMPSTDLLELLKSWDVPCNTDDGFHYFPRSQKAGDILSALRREMKELKVDLRCDIAIEDISTQDDLLLVTASGGQTFCANSVILATGGAGYAPLGGGMSGYSIADKLGHNVITPVPGLVGLRTVEDWPGKCTGITIPDVYVKIEERGFKGRAGYGDLLFTHRGLSGPPVIDVSGAVCRLLLKQKSVKLSMQLCGTDRTPEDWNDLFLNWRQTCGKRLVHNVVATLLPKRIASILCCECGIPDDMVTARLPGKAETQLMSILKKTPVNITSSEGFKQAMVTAGGVSLKEVVPSTLESRLIPGLYFAGEIVDLDGPCGGFNLQWAISSGWLAGNSSSA